LKIDKNIDGDGVPPGETPKVSKNETSERKLNQNNLINSPIIGTKLFVFQI